VVEDAFDSSAFGLDSSVDFGESVFLTEAFSSSLIALIFS
jgi:hypothetical protein